MYKALIVSTSVLILASCSQLAGVNSTISKVCADYNLAKSTAASLPLPSNVQKTIGVIEGYVDPVCNGPSGPVVIDGNTISWVIQNIGGIGALLHIKF